MFDTSVSAIGLDEKQRQLVYEYVDHFNWAIHKNLSGEFNRKVLGRVMEREIFELVREKLKECSGVDVANPCFIKNPDGGVVQHDIVVYRSGKECREVCERYEVNLIDFNDVVAVIEVKTWADSAGYDGFVKKLPPSLINKGHFVGIAGSTKKAKDGLNIDINPKIFILSYLFGGNIRKHHEIDKKNVKIHSNVLKQFLDTLLNECENCLRIDS